MLGFTANEIIECLQILAFILKLGNVQFLRKANMDSTEGCSIFNDYGMLIDMIIELNQNYQIINCNYNLQRYMKYVIYSI